MGLDSKVSVPLNLESSIFMALSAETNTKANKKLNNIINIDFDIDLKPLLTPIPTTSILILNLYSISPLPKKEEKIIREVPSSNKEKAQNPVQTFPRKKNFLRKTVEKILTMSNFFIRKWMKERKKRKRETKLAMVSFLVEMIILYI